MNLYTYVGIVRAQEFEILLAEDRSSGICRLSSSSEAKDLEQQGIDLVSRDGLVLMVRGIRLGDWIGSAVIVETASELQSVIAQAALGRQPAFPKG